MASRTISVGLIFAVFALGLASPGATQVVQADKRSQAGNVPPAITKEATTAARPSSPDARPRTAQTQVPREPPTMVNRIQRWIWRFGRDPIAVLTLALFILGGIQLELSRRGSRRQLRPYVYAEEAFVNWMGEGIQVVIGIRNSGVTPATFFELAGAAEFLEIGSDRQFPPWGPALVWSALGGGQSTTAALHFAGISRSDLSRTQDNYLRVCGAVRYGTIFDEVFESEFEFLLKYRADKDQKMQRSTGRHRVFRSVGIQDRRR